MIRPPVANIDKILVVASLVSPKVDMYMIDAFLLSAEAAHIPAMLCINKSDLIDDAEVEAFRKVYALAGYPVVVTSTKEEEGVLSLRPHLQNAVTALAGNSGVGKSSILNAVSENFSMETGEVSERLLRGRHTTRHVELFPLSFGGFILDTPGFSRVELPGITADGLAALYPEIAAIEEPCRFAGCAHHTEPGCAVKEAVEAGKIHQKRYESYLYFYEKLRENKFWKIGKEE